MALEFFFNTQANSNSGTKLNISYARLQVTLLPNENTVDIRTDLYESSTAYFDNRNTINLDEIPNELLNFSTYITSVQYGNVDMTNIHNQIKNIFLIGASANNYPPIASNPDWGGLTSIDPLNAIAVIMPS